MQIYECMFKWSSDHTQVLVNYKGIHHAESNNKVTQPLWILEQYIIIEYMYMNMPVKWVIHIPCLFINTSPYLKKKQKTGLYFAAWPVYVWELVGN